jgi:hypothetical protein
MALWSHVAIAAPVADVIAVTTSGTPMAYRFAVKLASPDRGCQQFADWWEVVGDDGALIYRRILAHSHVDEQPFERSGAPVPIEADTIVWVRAHMRPGGYGGKVMRGSVRDGFEVATAPLEFALQLQAQPPLPSGCAF